MKNARILTSFILALVLFVTQSAVAFAAPPSTKAPAISGTVVEVTLITDANTGIVTVSVTVCDEAGRLQTVQVSEKTAFKLGLVDYDSNGSPFIVASLPAFVEIDSNKILADEELHHPVASALANFFSDIDGVDYNVIMDAHAGGNGFGVIAQTLWLIKLMGGTADDFVLLLDAKKNNDFQDFPLADGTIPTSWAELKKAVADQNLGSVMSKRDKNSSGENPTDGNANVNNNKDKNKDKSKNGNGSGTGNSGQGKGNGGNKP